MNDQKYYIVGVKGISGDPKERVLISHRKFFYRGKNEKDIEKKIERDREILKKEIGGPNMNPKRLEVLTIKEIKFKD